MKKLFAATLAAILSLSAAGCAKKPVQQEEPAAPVQEEAIVPEAPAEAAPAPEAASAEETPAKTDDE